MKLPKFGIYDLMAVAIVLLGAFFRFYGLGDKPFHEDEFWTVNHAINVSYYQTLFQIFDPGNLPFYYIFIKLVSQLFGVSEFSLRMFSAVTSSLCVWILYRLGQACKSRKVGLAAAALYAASPLSIVFAQMARTYSLLDLLVLTSVLFLVNYIQTRRNVYFVTFFILSFLGLSTHGFFVPVLLAEAIFIAIFNRCEWSKWFVGFLSLFVVFYIFLFWRYEAAFFFKQENIIHGDRFIPIWAHGLFALYGFALGETVYPFNLPVVLPAAILFGGTFLYSAFKARTETWFWLTLIIIVVVVTAWVSGNYYASRYLGCVEPLFLLVVAFGVNELKFGSRWKLFLISLMMIPQLVSTYFWYTGNPNQVLNASFIMPWREIVEDIELHCKQHDEMILVYPDSQYDPIKYYSQNYDNFVLLPEGNYTRSLLAVLNKLPDDICLLELPLGLRKNKITTDYFKCYQSAYKKEYVLNPDLIERFKSGKVSFSHAAMLSHYERQAGCVDKGS